ncbi:hypothetical protein HK102_013083 [Quaeritorhiza haematococci]|nr:hypothetical protein HK102_013083 [Quaeritorhiza haematococci]
MVSGPQYNGLDAQSWNTLHATAMMVIIPSIIGSLYIISKTLRTHFQSDGGGFMHYIPMFISIGDLTFGLVHLSDHFHNIIWSYFPDEGVCKALGFGMVTGMNWIATWTSAAAIVTMSTVVFRKVLNPGRYFWKAHLLAFGIPIVTGITALVRNEFGPIYMYCGATTSIGQIYSNTSYIVAAWFICLISYGLTTVVIYQTTSKLRASGAKSSMMTASNTSSSVYSPTTSNSFAKTPAMERLTRLAHHMPIFVLSYIITWFPWVFYTFVTFSGLNVEFGYLLAVVTFTNVGGVANALAYSIFLRRAKKGGFVVARGAINTGMGPASSQTTSVTYTAGQHSPV